jgi:tetratricopeptide (TPR) repeat protein
MKRNVVPEQDPPTLIEVGHSYAEVLARGNREYATPTTETAHFCRSHATSPDPRRGPRLVLTVTLAAAALVTLAFGLTARRESTSNDTIHAELQAEPSSVPAPRTLEAAIVDDASALALGGSSNAEPRRQREAPDSRPTRSHMPSTPDAESDARPQAVTRKPRPSDPRPAQADSVPRPDCRDHARGGEPHKAESCYLERAKGSGLDAETAFLEVARLRRDVLDDPAGALNALENYRERFPSGALRHEADIAHAVLLARLGRSSEALAETERLLESPQGRERAFELRLLRGNIYRKGLGNTALAAREYATAENLERANSEATYLLGSCLDELGDAEGAKAAYRRYLEDAPAGKRATDVQKRLQRLLP